MNGLRGIDFILLLAVVPLLTFGLLTMKSLGGNDYFFNRQLIWIALGAVAMGSMMALDWRNFKSSSVILSFYIAGVSALALLVTAGYTTRGARSWFYVGSAGVEPVEIIKLVLVLLFAKYFSGRYVEIALTRHILISFMYLALPVTLVFLQPDFGSAAILVFLWACMVVFSGLSLKQVLMLAVTSVSTILIGWFFLLAPYQKTRVIAFFGPERDPKVSGYHAIQAMIAVGSGGIWGKGVGYGTQSRLKFLPESETDFMFAAFAEEWGLVGVVFLLTCFALLFWRILRIGIRAPDNFSKLFCLGFSFLLIGHIAIHVGMNIGLLPITGIALPFVSYGGSFLVMLMASLGILESIAMRSSEVKAYGKDDALVLSP